MHDIISFESKATMYCIYCTLYMFFRMYTLYSTVWRADDNFKFEGTKLDVKFIGILGNLTPLRLSQYEAENTMQDHDIRGWQQRISRLVQLFLERLPYFSRMY